MSASIENHILYWQELTESLSAGKTLESALGQALARLKGSPLQNAAAGVAADVKSGLTLSAALSRHEAFPQSIRTLIRVGEAMGRMDQHAQTVLQCLREGSICPPSCTPTSGARVRFWRLMGRLLSSAIPILEAFEILTAESHEPMLVQAATNLHHGILEGKSMAECLAASPGFGAQTLAIISAAESTGCLDVAALELADALDKGPAAVAELAARYDPSTKPVAAAGSGNDTDADAAKQVNLLLLQAVQRRASDVHFDTREGGLGRIRLRNDGVLQEVPAPPPPTYRAMLERLKLMADMDVAEKRVPQDGRIQMVIHGESVDLRVSAVPAMFGERLVLRILRREAVILDLARLGFDAAEQELVGKLCRRPNGMIILNGPTGSGKTTTMYAMLQQTNRAGCNVITIEDPVEYAFDDIAQIRVNANVGATFPRLIRSVLRQDPDVIMVGEIRDLETAQLLVQCSLTGHLVLTSLHAATSPGALQRLLDMGLEPFLVASCGQAVITQYLIRCLCPHCRQPVTIPPAALPPGAAEILAGVKPTFYAAKGCDQCSGGYRGRTAIHEILVLNNAIRDALAANKGIESLRQAAIASGMRTLLADGLLKAAAGVTTLEEVLRVAPMGPNG